MKSENVEKAWKKSDPSRLIVTSLCKYAAWRQRHFSSCIGNADWES
jgi:hypothetical protein